MGSQKHVLLKLKGLTEQELASVRKAFSQNVHHRFLQELCYSPFVKRDVYREKVETASLEKLAKLIQVTALLLQTKVYLFWQGRSDVG